MMRHVMSLAIMFACLACGAAHARPYLDIRSLRTEKGITAWYVPDDSIPVLAVSFSFAGGSQFDPVGREGAVMLLSTMLDEGAGPRDSETFQRDMDVHGIQMAFSAGLDRFTGNVKMPTVHADTGFALLSDALNRPHMSVDAIARMKDALASQLRLSSQRPAWLASRAFFEAAFAGTPYARPREGTLQTLASLAREDVLRVKERLLCRDNVLVAVAGKIDEKMLMDSLDRTFGGLPPCTEHAEKSSFDMQQSGGAKAIPRAGAQYSVLMAQPGVARQNNDWWAARILNHALGGGQFSSRLMDEIRVRRSLTYGISSGISPYDRAPLWVVQLSVDPARAGEALGAIHRIWDDVAQNGLSEDEIASAKDYLIGSLPLALTSTGNIASVVLQMQEDRLPIDTLDRRNDEITAVTQDDIKRVAQQYLSSKRFLTILVGPDTVPAISGETYESPAKEKTP